MFSDEFWISNQFPLHWRIGNAYQDAWKEEHNFKSCAYLCLDFFSLYRLTSNKSVLIIYLEIYIKNYLEIVLKLLLRCIRQIKWVGGTKISLCVLPYLKVGVLIFNINIILLFFLYLTIICLWLTELWLRWEKPRDITYFYFLTLKIIKDCIPLYLLTV